MNKKIVSTVLVLSIILQLLLLKLGIVYVHVYSMGDTPNSGTLYYTVPKRGNYTFNKSAGGASTGLPSTYTHMGAYKVSISFEYMDTYDKSVKGNKNELFADGLLGSTGSDINKNNVYYQFGTKFRDRILKIAI